MTNLIRRNHDSRDFATNGTNPAWDAFRMMDALLGWDSLREGTRLGHLSAFTPTFDVEELKDAYVVKADLPGLRENDLDVTVMGNALTISGKREAEQEREGQRYYALERGYGAFSRTVTLPDGANLDDLSANLKDGVLTLHIPKRPEVQPRKINLGNGGAGA
ncbi:MAG TPA: Hsp20/alpha crystallin family protein [Polyangia bacterium]|nr:Hsp20/alpha crystallin family protein [Polyangia bacterium]